MNNLLLDSSLLSNVSKMLNRFEIGQKLWTPEQNDGFSGQAYSGTKGPAKSFQLNFAVRLKWGESAGRTDFVSGDLGKRLVLQPRNAANNAVLLRFTWEFVELRFSPLLVGAVVGQP